MVSLEQARKDRGLTQAQLAALSGVSAQDICAIERGWRKPYPAWRKKLATALNVQEEVIFTDRERID